MQRIRYKQIKNKENLYESIKTFISKSTGAIYRVRIDLDKKQYEIRNLTSFRAYYGGENINNLNVLKRKAKAHLESLGVVFSIEERNRTFGLCRKGYTQNKYMEEIGNERLRKIAGH